RYTAVSAKAFRPSRVPENVSRKYPSMKAATAPATDCRRTATLTVRMSTRSGTIGSPGTIGKTLVWRSMATAAALARATMARTLSSGRGGRLGRRDRAARHQHLLELVEVDAGRDLRRLEEPLS